MKIFQLIDWLTKLFKLNNKAKAILLVLLPLPIFSQNNAAFWLGKRASAAPANLLLDDYPGAAAAYSVRKLDKDYTGFAMEIRRQSDNATQNIGFVGENLNEAAINSFCSTTNCYVQTWYDQSGNGRNATQLSTANQPLIYSSGTIQLKNSKPTIKFDGSNDYFLVGSVFANNVIISAFVVTHSDAVNLNQYLYDNSINSSYGGGYSHRYLSTGGFRIWAQDATRNASGGATTNGIQYLTSRISNSIGGETNILFQNGAQVGIFTGIPSTRDAKVNTNIGRSELLAGYLNGGIQDLIVYSVDKSAERIAIETNINSYYSIY